MLADDSCSTRCWLTSRHRSLYRSMSGFCAGSNCDTPAGPSATVVPTIRQGGFLAFEPFSALSGLDTYAGHQGMCCPAQATGDFLRPGRVGTPGCGSGRLSIGTSTGDGRPVPVTVGPQSVCINT